MRELSDLIVLDPLPDGRMRLKQIALATHRFKDIHIARSLERGIELLQDSGRQSFGTVVASCRFEQDCIHEFLAQGKHSLNGRDGAFMLVLDSGHSAADISGSVLTGADGFLIEPFGVEAFEEVLGLSSQVKLKRAADREVAVSVLLDESMLQLDSIAQAKLSGCEPTERLQYFRDLGEIVIQLGAENLESYHQIAIQKFVDRPPTTVFGRSEQAQVLQDRLEDASVTEAVVADPIIDEALAGLGAEFAEQGLTRELLQEAVRRVKECLAAQGIHAKFALQESGGSAKESRDQAIMRRLEQRLREKGMSTKLLH